MSGAGVEGSRQMVRQGAWRNQHGIETQVEIGMFRVRHQPCIGGIDDAFLLARRYGVGGGVQRGTGLDLDEGQQAASLGDDVDLTVGCPETSGQKSSDSANRWSLVREGRSYRRFPLAISDTILPSKMNIARV